MRALIVLLLLGACNAENDGPVARAAAGEHPDGAAADVEAPDAAIEMDDAEIIESRVAEVLASDDFRDATCRLAGVAAAGQGAGLTCSEVVEVCLSTVGALDASVPPGGAILPDTAFELPDCELTVEQVDACMAELVTLVVDLSSEIECGVDAGAVATSVGPEALLRAPSCLLAATRCPALLELFVASMPQ